MSRSPFTRILRLSSVAALLLFFLLAPQVGAKGSGALEVSGFTVEIAGAGSGSDVDSAWETCSGGALCIEVSDSSTGSDGTVPPRKSVTSLQLRGPLTATRGVNENSYEVLENGAGRFRLEIDGLPVANAEAVSVEDLTIDERELTTGADWDYRVYGPGDAHYGSITIRSRVGKDSKELYQWWLDTSRGQNIRKNISVICLKRDGSEARRFNFHECYPTCYAPFEFDGDIATETLTLQCEGVSLESAGTRKALCDWITNTVRGQDGRRTVTIKEITKDGSDGKAYEFQDCFPTRYVFPAWRASGSGPLHETINVKPDRIEPR